MVKFSARKICYNKNVDFEGVNSVCKNKHNLQFNTRLIKLLLFVISRPYFVTLVTTEKRYYTIILVTIFPLYLPIM